jgi:hypothetical protein
MSFWGRAVSVMTLNIRYSCKHETYVRMQGMVSAPFARNEINCEATPAVNNICTFDRNPESTLARAEDDDMLHEDHLSNSANSNYELSSPSFR